MYIEIHNNTIFIFIWHKIQLNRNWFIYLINYYKSANLFSELISLLNCLLRCIVKELRVLRQFHLVLRCVMMMGHTAPWMMGSTKVAGC